jgi:hypothetical protein
VNAHLEQLKHELAPLSRSLHEALGGARADTLRHASLFATEDRKWLRSELFRANLGDHLAECLPPGWSLDGEERRHFRGALSITGAEGYILARVQRVTSDGTLPEPRSGARKCFYANDDVASTDLLGRCRHQLMLTYVESPGELNFTVRAIRPYADGRGSYEIVMPCTTESFEASRFKVINDDSYQQLFGDEFGGDAARL